MTRASHPDWSPSRQDPLDLAGVEYLARLRLVAVERQLTELGRMRAVAMGWTGRLEKVLKGKVDSTKDPAFRRSRGFINDLALVFRVMRQIWLLEQELLGLRPSMRRAVPTEPSPADAPRNARGTGRRRRFPQGDDTADVYDQRPVGQTVGWIRQSLGMEAPPGDPFNARPPAPEPEAEPGPPPEPEPAPSEPEAAAPSPAAAKKRARGRAYDLDFRDEPGNPLDEAADDAALRAGLPVRGPP
jgi:hypothetical protein